MQLKDKTAVITGAATGIGRTAAESFIAERGTTGDVSSYMRGTEIAADGGRTSI